MTSATSAQPRPAFWWARWVPAAVFAVALVMLAVTVGRSILVPLLASFALAFMLEPFANHLQRRGLSRNFAVLTTILVTTLVVTGVLILLLPSVWNQLTESVEKLPLALSAAGERLERLVDYARDHLSAEMFAQVQTAIANFRADPSPLINQVTAWLRAGVFGIVSFGSTALGLLIVPFFVYYLLLDLYNIRRAIEERIPERHRGVGAKLFDEVGEVVRGYVRGRSLLALAMAAVYTIGLLVLDVPLAAAIGLIAGIVGIIPYLGVLSGLVLAIGFAALDGASVARIGGVVGVFVAAQLIEDYVLTPRLIGDRLELHPMLVFIALIIAGDLFGLLGLVLAIPALGVGKVLIRFLDELYLRSDFYLAAPVASSARSGTPVQRAAAEAVSHEAQEADADRSEETRESVPRPSVPR